MKRNIKKSSRRKWVVGGIAFFGSVALLTTGFATWVIGAQQTSSENNVTVGVDTTQNQGVVFTMTLSDSALNLSEPKEIEAGAKVIVSTDKPFENNSDMTITISTISIEIGAEALESYNKISLEITSTNNNVKDDTTNTRDGEGPWTYLALATTEIDFKGTSFTRSPEEEETPSDVITYSLKKPMDITFNWGSYYKTNSQTYSPAAYYNSKYDTLDDNMSQSIANINSEFTALANAFKKPLVVTAKLVA